MGIAPIGGHHWFGQHGDMSATTFEPRRHSLSFVTNMAGLDDQNGQRGKLRMCDILSQPGEQHEDQYITNAQWQCGSKRTVKSNVDSLERAQELCRQLPDCTHYSWDKQNKKLLMCPESKFHVTRKQGFISGVSFEKVIRKGLPPDTIAIPNHRAACRNVIKGPIHNTFSTAQAAQYCAAAPGCTHWTMSTFGATTRADDLWLCGGKAQLDNSTGFITGVRTGTGSPAISPGVLGAQECKLGDNVLSGGCDRFPNACLSPGGFMM
eukprot:GEMP01017003.1.p1 GENE.GEMP01017003.1~~GEMP01017003.1.p1  ORF type:complete len:265 (+),score=47.54 GEMP01017003.1:103-897(+)